MVDDTGTGEAEKAVVEDTTPGPMTFDRMIKGGDDGPKQEKTQDEDGVSGDNADDEGGSDEGDNDEEGDSADTDESSGDDESDSEDGSGEPEESDEEGDKADEAEEAEEKESPEENLEKLSKEAKGKTVLVKHNGKDVPIPADAKFSFEKDGKQVSFTLKEAANNLWTRREIDQGLSKLDREKKTLEREKRDVTKIQLEYQDLEDSVALIKEAAQSGNMFNVAQATLNVFSRGNEDVAKRLVEDLVDLTQKVSGMTEEQLAASVRNSQLEFKNKKLEKEKTKLEAREEQIKRRNWLDKMIKTNGITWEEYIERYQALKDVNENRIKQGQPPRIHDNMTYEQVAQEVVNFTQATRIYNKIVGVIKKVDATQVDNPILIDQVAQLTDKTFSEKDIADIVRGVLGTPRKKIVSKPNDSSKDVSKVAAAPKKEPAKKGATPQKAPVGKETKKDDEDDGPVTFDKIKKKYQA